MTNTSKRGFIFHQTQQNKSSANFFSEKQHCHSDIFYNLNRPCKHFNTFTIYTATFLSSSVYYFWHVKRPKESEQKKIKPFKCPLPCSCSIFFHDQNDRTQSFPLAHSSTMRYEQLYISLFSSFVLVSVLWFIVMCFFTLFFCIVRCVLHQKLYYRYNIDTFTYGRCIHCTINLSWRSDRCWHQDASVVFLLFLLTLA